MLNRLINAMERRGWCKRERFRSEQEWLEASEKMLRVMLGSSIAIAIILLLVLACGLSYFKGLNRTGAEPSYDIMVNFGANLFLGLGIFCGTLLLLTVGGAYTCSRRIRKRRAGSHLPNF